MAMSVVCHANARCVYVECNYLLLCLVRLCTVYSCSALRPFTIEKYTSSYINYYYSSDGKHNGNFIVDIFPVFTIQYSFMIG